MPHPLLALRQPNGPVFARDRATFEQFLAGQLACLRELTLFLAPNINSYKRYAEGSFAPTAVAWAEDNRTCSLRVVGHGAALRFENRAGGSDLNPYLALSAIIAAGLHGVENGLELEAPYAGNAYKATDKPRLPDDPAGCARDCSPPARWRAPRSAKRWWPITFMPPTSSSRRSTLR